MLSQTILLGYHCFNQVYRTSAGRCELFQMIYHWAEAEMKYFSSCYFPLLLAFWYPLALEAEVLRNRCG